VDDISCYLPDALVLQYKGTSTSTTRLLMLVFIGNYVKKKAVVPAGFTAVLVLVLVLVPVLVLVQTVQWCKLHVVGSCCNDWHFRGVQTVNCNYTNVCAG
jgi:hypothetical protein